MNPTSPTEPDSPENPGPSSEHDDMAEALSWAGDQEADLLRPKNIKDSPSETAAANRSEQKTLDPLPAPSAWPVIFGVFGGIYILYVVGWALHIFTHQVPHYDVLSAIMGELSEALAIVGPIFWFFAVLVIVPAKRPVMRLIWFIIGSLVMIPWPLIISAVVN